MFALNINGIFVLAMFNKSYFPEWGSLPLMVLMAVLLTSQHPVKKHMLLRHRLLRSQTTYRTVVHTKIKFSNCFLTYNFFRIKYLRQPSIDFDLCNLSSSGDVVYKER